MNSRYVVHHRYHYSIRNSQLDIMGCQASTELGPIEVFYFSKSNKISDECITFNKKSVINTDRSSRQSTARGSNASTLPEQPGYKSIASHVTHEVCCDKLEDQVATEIGDDIVCTDNSNLTLDASSEPDLISFLTSKNGHIMSYLVSNWLDLNSVMALDHALVRNKFARPHWLNLLKTQVEVRNKWMNPLRVNDKMIEWIVKRQVSVEYLFSRDKSLQKMNLSKSTLSDIALVRLLVNTPSLRHIDLYKCSNLSEASVIILSTLCPKVQKVDNLSITSFSTANFESLSKCRELRSLTSYSHHNQNPDEILALNDVGVYKLVSVCQSIQHLDLIQCTNITDTSLVHLSANCLNLIDLRLDGCKLITDTGLSKLAQGVPNLSLLSLAGCIRLTDAGITAIANGCPALKTLDISRCINVSNTSIKALAESCPELNCLVYSKGPRITDKGLARLSKRGCRLIHR